METTSQLNLKVDNKKPNDFTLFLCRIAGSDLTILAQCPHEYSRHARIGAVILVTSALAFISMFFAIQTISQSSALATVAGFLWAIAIFVLDSYIVASYKKNDDKMKEFQVAIPRLVLALILGCTISIPMELKIFSNEIGQQMEILEIEKSNEKKDEAKKAYEKDIAPYESEKNKLLQDNTRFNGELKPLNDRVISLENELRDEVGARGRTGKHGYGTMAKSIDDQLKSARSSYEIKRNDIGPMLESNNARIKQLDSLIATVSVRSTEAVDLYGISAQLDALKRLTSNNNYVLLAYWIFFLLILGIETAPIFVKFFTPKGSYDQILENKEYLIFLEQQRKKSDIHESINQELDEVRSLYQYRKQAQDQANESLMNAIAEAQGEIARKAISLWKQKQLSKVEENLENFIRTSTNHFAAPLSNNHVSLLVNKWKQKGSIDAIEYHFKNGTSSPLDLLYVKNSEIEFGKWTYDKQLGELDIYMSNERKKYSITDISEATLRLLDKSTNSVLELEKV